MTLGKQIGLSLGGMIAACAAMGVVSGWSTRALAGRLDESVGVTTRKIELAGEIRANVLMFRLQERGMLLFSFIKADAQVASCRDSYDKALAASLDKIGAIRALTGTDRGQALMGQVEASIIEYRTQQLEVRRLLAAHQIPQAAEWDKKKLVTEGAKIMAALEQFSDLMHSLNVKSNEEAAGLKTTAKTSLTVGMIGCALLGLLAIVAMRRATHTLQMTTTELRTGADEVATAAAQVSTSSQTLAQGCSQQAAWLEETSATGEEISSMTRNNSAKSRAAADLVSQSQHSFEETNQLLEQTVAAMTELNQQSGKISSVIKVIDGIAFQTNILALNAAVEAARAGEAGMGFAVVADEVRSLAQRCAQAAKDTSELIEQSIAKSKDGKSKVDQVAAAIHEIIGQAAKVKDLVDEVNSGGQEQARGAEQIGHSITKIEKVTEQTAASAEEGAAAAEQLTAQSQAFKSIVERLNALVGAAA